MPLNSNCILSLDVFLLLQICILIDFVLIIFIEYMYLYTAGQRLTSLAAYLLSKQLVMVVHVVIARILASCRYYITSSLLFLVPQIQKSVFTIFFLFPVRIICVMLSRWDAKDPANKTHWSALFLPSIFCLAARHFNSLCRADQSIGSWSRSGGPWRKSHMIYRDMAILSTRLTRDVHSMLGQCL